MLTRSGTARHHVDMLDLPVSYNLEAPWERQPCDTEARWRAFLAYRGLPAPRTLRAASEALARDGKGFDLRTLERWSSEDAWPERCLAFDRYLDSKRVEATADVLAEDARTCAARHVELLRDLQAAAAHVAKGWLQRIARGEALDGWTPGDVSRVVRDAIKLERLIRGEATERVEHGIGIDLSLLSLEEVETLRMLEAKAGVTD